MMRIESRPAPVALLTALIVLFWETQAAADEAESDPPDTLAAFRGTLGSAGNGHYVLTDLSVGYRLTPMLVAGVFLENTLLAGASSDGACQNEGHCGLNWVRLGPRAEVHPLPLSVVSPWAAAGFGYGSVYTSRGGRHWDALVGLFELGVDVYPVRAFGFGPLIAYEPTTSLPESASIFSVGLRLAARF